MASLTIRYWLYNLKRSKINNKVYKYIFVSKCVKCNKKKEYLTY